MNSGIVVLAAGCGFVISWLSIPVIRQFRPIGRRQLHQTHTQPVSRFGGVALVMAFMAVAAAWLVFSGAEAKRLGQAAIVFGSAFAMFLVGFWDDVQPIGAKKKLIFQILIASCVYAGGIHIDAVSNPFGVEKFDLGAWSYIVTVLWLITLTNLINLIDGIDGLAGGISLMVMGLLLFLGWQTGRDFAVVCTAATCGALIAFLRFNFPPATIYLGDGGAYFLGFLAAILALVHSQKATVAASLVAPLFVLALPIVDVTLAILRRGLKGMPVFRPDRRHLHHRLAQTGLSRRRVVLIFYGMSLFFLALGLSVILLNGAWLPLIAGAGCMALFISARSFEFSREWFDVRRVLGNSQAVRKDTRHALVLERWFELEAERDVLPEVLWQDFTFVCGKLGFTDISLSLADAQRAWINPDHGTEADEQRRRRFQLPCGGVLEVGMPSSFGSDQLELLSEIAAETWIKGVARWEKATRIRFSLRRSVPTNTCDGKLALGTVTDNSVNIAPQEAHPFIPHKAITPAGG